MGNNSTVWNEMDLVYQMRWSQPILICLGFLGNSLSMYMFFCKKVCYSSSSIYLGTLAISDNVFLITSFMNWFSEVNVTDLFQRSNFLCQCIYFLFVFSNFVSVWLVVIFTIERYVVTKWPLRRQSWCTVTRAKIVVTVLTALMITSSTPVPLLIKSERNNATGISFCMRISSCMKTSSCKPNTNAAAYLIYIYAGFGTFMAYGGPQILIIIFNILIALNIFKQANVRRTMTNIATIESNTANERNLSRNEISETKITKMLLLVSTAFILLNLPGYITALFPYFIEDEPSVGIGYYLMYEIGDILYVANFEVNFFLYCVSGQNFRKALIRIFWKR